MVHPKDSLPYLEKFHKSALKVENLSKSLHKASTTIGFVGSAFFIAALGGCAYNLLASSAQAHT